MDRRVGQREAFALGQQLAQVLVVDPGVGGLGEVDDPGAGRLIDAPGRPATAVPVDQGPGAVPAERSAQAPDLTGGEAQEVSRFGHALSRTCAVRLTMLPLV